MVFKIIITILFLSLALFVAFRFGLFGTQLTNIPSITEFIDIPQLLHPAPSITATPSAQLETTIKVLNPPLQAATNQKFIITWFIESPKVATTSHTAIHFGKISKPNARLPSDYPEKSAILKGPIPATFSATLSIGLTGLYYYRAHTIIEDVNVWSDEQTINIVVLATSSANPSLQ